VEKKPRQGPPKLPSRAEPQAPLFPTDDSSPKESLPQPLTKGKKRQRLEQARKLHERDWLAPVGSVQEKQFLERWAKQENSQERRALICKWIDNPIEFASWMKNSDKFGKRNELFWQTAKKSALGEVSYGTAMERHETLEDTEWLVAYFTAQCTKQKEIARLIQLSDSAVDKIVQRLKKRISQELNCDIEIDDRIQIARWFLGL
jgi:hypothetical protein